MTGDPADLAGACGAVAIITSRAFLEDDPEAVERIHAAGLGVLAYTLNRADAWEQALALGVDGFITDDSAALGDWLGARPSLWIRVVVLAPSRMMERDG